MNALNDTGNRTAAKISGFCKKKLNKRNENFAYVLITPYYIFYLIFIVVPVVMNLYYSFTNYNLYKTKDFVGLANYMNLIRDKVFILSIKNTFIYGCLNVIPLIIIGFIVAFILNRGQVVSKVQRIFFFIPYITSMVAVSMIWLLIYNPTLGILNKLLIFTGLTPRDWLFDTNLALPCLVVMGIWKNLGYVMLIYLAGLQSIPGDLYEAAKIDGANEFQNLVKITIPLISPITFFLFVTECIDSFKVFEQVNIMTNGGPLNSTTTIVHQIYLRAFTEFRFGYAASMSTILMVIVVIITLLNFRFGKGQNMDVV